jgi:hypothetical protein
MYYTGPGAVGTKIPIIEVIIQITIAIIKA